MAISDLFFSEHRSFAGNTNSAVMTDKWQVRPRHRQFDTVEYYSHRLSRIRWKTITRCEGRLIYRGFSIALKLFGALEMSSLQDEIYDRAAVEKSEDGMTTLPSTFVTWNS
jgi:hypothetical protein